MNGELHVNSSKNLLLKSLFASLFFRGLTRIDSGFFGHLGRLLLEKRLYIKRIVVVVGAVDKWVSGLTL